MGRSEYIICGTIALPNCELAWCARCQAFIYPTTGTVRAAREDHAELICPDCFIKLDDRRMGGYSHHGIRMPDATLEQMLELLERDLRRFKC